MTDLELIDKFCDTCLNYVHPFILQDVQNRGLIHIVNRLPSDPSEAKAVCRARLSKLGQYVGDPEIEWAAGIVSRIDFLKAELLQIPSTDVHKILDCIREMHFAAKALRDYFKQQ